MFTKTVCLHVFITTVVVMSDAAVRLSGEAGPSSSEGPKGQNKETTLLKLENKRLTWNKNK